MNKLINFLDISQWSLLAISIVDITNIICMISAIVSLLVGVLSLVLKIKTYAADGIIDEKEKEDLMKEIEELKKIGKDD